MVDAPFAGRSISSSAALGEAASPGKRGATGGGNAPAVVRTYSDALLPGDLSGSSVSDALHVMRKHYAPLGFLGGCTISQFVSAIRQGGVLREARPVVTPSGSRPS